MQSSIQTRVQQAVKKLAEAVQANRLNELLITCQRIKEPPGYLVDGTFVSDEMVDFVREVPDKCLQAVEKIDQRI